MKNSRGREIGFLENFIYGMLIGIFEVVPGISGGTLALILGVYEALIGSLSNIRKNFKESIKVLLPSVFGMAVGVYCFSYIISFLNKRFPIEVSFFLTGLILGVIPYIISKALSCSVYGKSNRFSCLASLAVTILFMAFVNYFSLSLGGSSEIIKNLTFIEFIRFSLVGMFACFCLMLPGCSGSMMMLVFGVYYSVIDAIHNLNFLILLPVGMGVLIGFFVGSKIIWMCLNKFKQQTFFAILGLIIGSCVSPFLGFIKHSEHILDINYLIFHGTLGIFTLAIGFIFSFFFTDCGKKEY